MNEYFHSECLGCDAYGSECEIGCEWSEYDEPCSYFHSAVSDSGGCDDAPEVTDET